MRVEGTSGSDRDRLPEQVEPGRTYRDAEISGWLEDSVSITTRDQALSDAGRAGRRRT